MNTASRPSRLFWLSDSTSAHTLRWVRALAARGHEILLFSLTEPKNDALASIPGVSVESADIDPALAYGSVGAWRKVMYAKVVPRVLGLRRSFGPDICHAHYASSYGAIGVLAGLRPLAVSIWGADVYLTPNRSALHRWLVAGVLRRADIVLSTSRVMREQGLKLAPVNTRVIPFGVDLVQFSPGDNSVDTSRDLVVGTVKSLEPKYGIDYLVRAFAILRKAPGMERVKLLIAGDGSQRAELEQRARREGVHAAMQFLGAVNNERVPEIYRKLDVAIFPSIDDSESFCVSAVEAQACGTPVVASRVGGLPEVVEDGHTGLLVPSRDEHELARAISSLLVDPPLRRRMGAAGRERVVRHFDLERCVDELQREYSALQSVS